MEVLRSVILGVAALAVAAPSASPPGHVSPDGSHVRASRGAAQAVLVASARDAFDDGRPLVSGVAQSAPVVSAVSLAPAPPPRPPRDAVSGSSPRPGSPQAVLAAAYRRAVGRVPASCHLTVSHLAAIGQLESGSVGGRTITSGHRVSPPILGPLLDGGPFAVIRDSDGGMLDGASDFDRAMGPLQFLPGTWRWAGRDGDGDGRRDPQNVYDAAWATAVVLCDGGRDLSRTAQLRAAIWSYNQSPDYVAAALEWVAFFDRHGLAALNAVCFRVGSGGRASDLPAPTADDTVVPTAPSASAPARPEPAGATPAPGTTAHPTPPAPAATPTGVPVPASSPTTPPATPPAAGPTAPPPTGAPTPTVTPPPTGAPPTAP